MDTKPVPFPYPGVVVNEPLQPEIIEKVVLDLKGREYPEPVKMPGDKKPATWNFD